MLCCLATVAGNSGSNRHPVIAVLALVFVPDTPFTLQSGQPGGHVRTIGTTCGGDCPGAEAMISALSASAPYPPTGISDPCRPRPPLPRGCRPAHRPYPHRRVSRSLACGRDRPRPRPQPDRLPVRAMPPRHTCGGSALSSGPAGRLAAPQQLRDHAVGVVRDHDQLRRFPGRRVHPDLVQLDHRNVLAPASAVICTASCGASPAAARPAPWHPSLVFQSVLGRSCASDEAQDRGAFAPQPVTTLQVASARRHARG